MPLATISKGEINPVVQMALRPYPEMTKLNVPMIFDFIKAEYARPEFTVEQAMSCRRTSQNWLRRQLKRWRKWKI